MQARPATSSWSLSQRTRPFLRNRRFAVVYSCAELFMTCLLDYCQVRFGALHSEHLACSRCRTCICIQRECCRGGLRVDKMFAFVDSHLRTNPSLAQPRLPVTRSLHTVMLVTNSCQFIDGNRQRVSDDEYSIQANNTNLVWTVANDDKVRSFLRLSMFLMGNLLIGPHHLAEGCRQPEMDLHSCPSLRCLKMVIS